MSIKCLRLFDIVQVSCFSAAESCLAVRPSHEIDWSLCAMEKKCYPYDCHTGIVHHHASLVENAVDKTVGQSQPVIRVAMN